MLEVEFELDVCFELVVLYGLFVEIESLCCF